MSCVIDGRSLPVHAPQTVDELRRIVADAVARKLAVYPIGGRTMLSFGLPPARDGLAVDTTGLGRVIDYPSRDMTITVEAGIRVAKLQEILQAEGQRLPVDVPRAHDATIGGAIATNTSGSRRYGFGTLRDYVIGISVVDAAGRESKAGGRVVKNVAGYDLCKLYTGSFGSLGIISQVTLKLRPLCEASAIAWIQLPHNDAASEAIERLARSATRPSAIDVLNPPAAECVAPGAAPPIASGRWVLVVGFEETCDAVAWQRSKLIEELDGLVQSCVWFEDSKSLPIWRSLAEFQLREGTTLSFKANVKSSASFEFLDAVRRLSIPWSAQAHAGNGVVFGHVAVADDLLAVSSSLSELRARAVAMKGNLIVRHCPTEWKSQLAIWGEPRGDTWLMRDLKRKLDPDGVLNPGRFVE
jgi:glycolate oxidase FAD binding subunit